MWRNARLTRRALVGLLMAMWVGGNSSVMGQVSLAPKTYGEQVAESNIRRALETVQSYAVQDEPLSQVARLLSEQFRVPVVIDSAALQDDGLNSDVRVTLPREPMTLQSMLDLSLREVGLAWTVRAESLVVTTRDGVERRLETRVYPVRDLVVFPYQGELLDDFDSLIDTITTTIAPETWENVGGPGSIREFWNGGAAVLVCSQTFPIHQQIEHLLTSLRTARRMQGVGSQDRARGRVGESVPFRDQGDTRTWNQLGLEHPRSSTPRRSVSGSAAAWQVPQVHK